MTATVSISEGSASYWEWDLGDGAVLSDSGSVDYAYAGSGTYAVLLVVGDVGQGCLDTVSTVAVVAEPVNAGSDTAIAICESDPVLSLSDLLTPGVDLGSWVDPNGDLFSGSFDPAVSVPGIYAYVVPGQSCDADTAFVNVSIVVCTPECLASAGFLSANAEEVCLDGGTAMLSATPDGSGYAPAGYETLYVLTSGSGLVIQDVSTAASFTVSDTGSYTIHTLVYDPNTLDLGVVTPGVTTGFDVNGLLLQGGGEICAALDVAGAPVDVVLCSTTCEADAGTLSGFKPTDCLQTGGTYIGGITNGDAVIPTGYQRIFVLTEGPDLVIQQTSNNPIFLVTAIGQYTVHTLVYDPNTLDLSIVVPGVTTGFDVNALLIQGGGDICASLDVTGTTILVDNPDAGGLAADAEEVCLDGGTAMLSATPDGNGYAPAGYETLYVLTSGSGLVIQDVSTAASFTVSDTGSYTIHTLVYDPNTLDLGVVTPGVTTGFDVNGLLLQGGGEICAALDVAGAPVDVVLCSTTCEADAGTLSGFKPTDCLQTGGTYIGGITNGDAVIPTGYQRIFVLTEGPDLVIQQTSNNPIFLVTAIGQYTVHTLVYDPNTLDLSIVVPGVTTGFDVNALLIQGGGDICASLDVTGTTILVDNPDAGGLAADAEEVCLDGGTAMLSATPDGNSYAPAGYETLYVLTSGSGLVIQDVSTAASFTVSDTGSYTIHTLVYDPNTLDLGVVTPGVTTGFDVNGLLLQGGGEICAALDVAGAPVDVVLCFGSPVSEASLPAILFDPTTGTLEIKDDGHQASMARVRILDGAGRTLMVRLASSLGSGMNGTVPPLSTGIYFVVMEGTNGERLSTYRLFVP
ncbi:MAG: T9SS C-terminal target domain-containing protein [Flavobacteriales bacterium]|nr:T9SS C-terminal target domain-containing protein [Flavobacteriales bacterium]